MLVVRVGWSNDGAVRQASLGVDADVQLHAEVPLLPLPGLVHLRGALALGILGRARCVDDGAGADLHAMGLPPSPG